MTTIDIREAKLPKWAQLEMARLRAQAEHVVEIRGEW